MRPEKERRIEHPADRQDREEAAREAMELAKRLHDENIRRAYEAVAAMPEGRVVLREWIGDFDAAMAASKFRGNSMDSYNLGRAYQAEEIRRTLKNVLPREMYLEIIYPKGERNGYAE